MSTASVIMPSHAFLWEIVVSSQEQPERIYEPNPKHKRGCVGDGPPRWFPSADSLCPDDLDISTAQELLETGVVDTSGDAIYQVYEGEFFKAYRTQTDPSGTEVWHGYPVRRSRVKLEIPAKALREFCKRGAISRPEYKKLLGSA